MKRLFPLTLFIFLCFISFAQPWLKNLPQHNSRSELNFFDYKNAFEEYWAPFNVEKGYYVENGVKKKARGWKQFKRWEYAMQSEINPRTGEFPRKTAQQVYDEFVLSHPQHRSNRSAPQADWQSLGPDHSNSGYSGIGRINCIAFHPTNIATFWVGSAAGGLWVTTNNASTWTCLTDNNGVLAVSNIVIAPDYETSHTIYIATGDRDGWDNRSIGVLKSTNGGLTWNPTGLSFTIFDGQMVNRLLMDPTNSEILIAATVTGVYRTIDGGTNWSEQLSPNEYIDLEFQPGNSRTIYASTKYGQIFVSTDGAPFIAAFSDGSANRIELAVSPNQPTWVYAIASDGTSGLYGILKSEDSGLTFTQIFDGDSTNMLTWAADGSETGGQGWYDLCLAASPTDANTILLGGVNTWRSTNGGINWEIVSHWSGDQVPAVHADKHNQVYRYNGDVFECNDGGVYLSHDNGTTWADRTNGIVISQMYKLGVSQSDGGDIITGLQDNGTKIHSGDIWFDQIGGDGMECLIDYTDVNIQYGTLYYGEMIRTMDHWGSSTTITPLEASDGAWITPYIIDPVDPQILYAGYTEIYQTIDRGDNWVPISFFDSFETFQNMAIAPSDNHVLYVTTWNQIWKTVDTGGEWTNITNNLPTSDAGIRYVGVKHDDPNTLWVALGGYSTPGIYESKDGGLNWTNISAGLPPIPTLTVVQNKYLTSQVNLYAGTDLGVYYKRGDNEWTRFSEGLPNVVVTELEIYYAPDPKDSKLRAATYGRGLWETTIPYSSTPVSSSSNSSICSGSNASLLLDEYEGEIQWQDSTENGWVNVTDGSDPHSEEYETAVLSSTTYYRAIVSNPSDTLLSNVTTITVVPVPDDAGPILGEVNICQGDQDVVFSVDSIPNAETYLWSLPQGATGTGNTNSIVVDFSAVAQSGIITVLGRNSLCEGGSSELAIEVHSKPLKPSVGVIVQPTCEDSTGSVTLLNLPATGTWTLMSIPDSNTTTGTGAVATVTGLASGTHRFIVTNEFGCISTRSNNVIIFTHAVTPDTPVITLIGNTLESDAPEGNQWYDENGPIAGATDAEFIPTYSGNFYTIVTIEDCISAPSNIIAVEITGVSSIQNQHAIKIYPNPVGNELIIEIKDNTRNMQFEILNSLGQVVYNDGVMEKVVVNTKEFVNGVYVIKIDSGEWVEVRKVIKD